MSTREDNAEGLAPDSSGKPQDNGNGNGNLLKPKSQPKVIRVLTVFAYVLSVSMAAILLSIYYIFIWEGRPQLGARRAPEPPMPRVAPSSNPHQTTTTTTPNNSILNGTVRVQEQEMQQQMQIKDVEIFSIPATPPTTATTTSSTIEENTTWTDYDQGFDADLSKSSVFIKKLMFDQYPYSDND